jgi:hypothetical protein
MPELVLTYSSNGKPHSWTDVQSPLDEIKTLINTTGFDYENMQSHGIRTGNIRSHANAESGRIKVRNDSGGTLSANDVVYITGTYTDGTNNYPTVAKADSATTAAANYHAIGIIDANSSNNTDGTIVLFKEVSGLDTSGSTIGKPVYLSSTAGGWTLTRPTGGEFVQVVGYVTVVHASTGRIYFNLSFPQEEFLTGQAGGLGYMLDTDHDSYLYASADDTVKLKAGGTDVITATASTVTVTGALTTSGTVTFGSLSDGTKTITAFVDQDDMASNSATLVPTQQSVKAYVDSQTHTFTNATTVTITDNESTNEANALIFTAGGDVDGGNLGLESDGTLTYNPSTGYITATGLVGALTGNASGTSATVTGGTQAAITAAANLVTVGILNSGSITNGFGTIDTGSSTITTTGVISAGGLTVGSAVLVAAELETIDDVTAGTVAASKAVVVDSNKDAASFRNITLTGELDAGSLDISGNADIDGTLDVGNIAINTASIYATDLILGEDAQTAIDFGTANEIDFKVDNATRLTLTSGALYPVTDNQIDLGTSSLEFKDAFFDGTVTADAFAGPLTGTASTATVATTVTITDNESENENNAIVFTSGGDLDGGNLGLESDGDLYYNPSTGTLTVANVSVSGTFTTVNSVTMNANNAVVFEGATADAYETTLTSVDATADRTITLPNVAGYVPVLAAASTTQISSTPEELNILDGATVVVGEINALDLGATAVGNAIASKAVVLDSNKDYTGVRNFTLTGELDAATLDLSGAADIAGDLTLSAGADGALVFSNAGENSIKIPDNQASSLIIEEANNAYLTFVTTDSSEKITLGKKLEAGSVEIEGTGFDINGGAIDGTAIGAASASTGAFTSISATTNLTVGDNILLNSDSAVLSLGVDADATLTHDGTTGVTIAANPVTITSAGAATWSTSSGALSVTSAAALNVTPAAGSAIVLDGTISVDAGVVTGATSITSTAFVGDITGDVTGNVDTFTATANNSANETVYPVFVDGATGAQGAETDTGLTYNPSTGLLSSAGVTASGTVTYGSLSDGSVTITAFVDEDNMSSDSATLVPTQQSVKAYVDSQTHTTNATTVTITDNESADETNAIIFTAGGDVDGGNLGLESDGHLTYNPSSGLLSSTAVTTTGVVTAGGLTVGSAVLVAAELETIDGVTAGTVAASKAVVVDGSKNAGTFGTVTAGTFVGALTGNASGTAATVTGGTQAAITTAANLVTVGILNSGSINTSFGNINTGSSTITTTGAVSTGALTSTGNISFDGGSFVFNEAGADKDFRIEGDTEANLFVADASTDRIGIGTVAPDSVLHVQNGATVNQTADGNADEFHIEGNDSQVGITISGPANHSGNIFFADNAGVNPGVIAYDHSTDDMTFWSTHDVVFAPGNAQAMRISGGNASIGPSSTAVPTARFEILDDSGGFSTSSVAASIASSVIAIDGNNDGRIYWHVDRGTYRGMMGYAHAGDTYMGIWDNGSATNPTLACTGGDVGIGTISPDGTLHVNTGDAGATISFSAGHDDLIVENAGTAGMTIASTDAANGGIMFATPSQDYVAEIRASYNSGSEFLLFKVADVECMTITDAARVGIGNTAPNARLTVDGTDIGANYPIISVKMDNIDHTLSSLPAGTAQTDDIFMMNVIDPASDGGGTGMVMMGHENMSSVWNVDCWGGAPTTTDTTGSVGAMSLFAGQHDGSNGAVDMAANSNLLTIGEMDSSQAKQTRLLLKADDGELHLGNTTLVALDFEDDNQLVRAMQRQSGSEGFIDSKYENPFYDYDKLQEAGLAGGKDKEGFFLFPLQSRLHAHEGAMWQSYCQIKELKELVTEQAKLLESTTQRLEAAEKRIAA